MVTNGAMAMAPVPLPASLLIFKDLSFRGFWLSGGWAARAGPRGRAALLDRLGALYQEGALAAPKWVAGLSWAGVFEMVLAGRSGA